MSPDIRRWNHGTPQHNGHHDDEEYDSDSSVTTIGTDEIRGHFVTRHNRLFHSHGNLPYPLPADGTEIQRLNDLHDAVKLLVGGRNYCGPVRELLLNPDNPRKKAVDLCTGTGKWVTEICEEFPDVKLYGLDIVPLATRYPPVNAQFEVHDVTTPLRWEDASIDFVHLRHASLGIRDYQALFMEIGRILHPGGLILVRDWENRIYPQNGTTLEASAPGTFNFTNAIGDVLAHREIFPLVPLFEMYLQHVRLFTQVTRVITEIKLGPHFDNDHEELLGVTMKRVLVEWGEATRGMLLDSGRNYEVVDQLIAGFRNEVMQGRGLKMKYHAVHALRL